MRAIVVHSFGDPSVLMAGELPVPEPGPGQILVRIAGAGVNPVDAKIRKGHFGARTFPFVPGVEAAGTVEVVGDGVEGVSPGDVVFGSGSGCYADYALMDASRLAAAPASLDPVDAGAAAVGAGTGLEGLDDHLHLGEGDRLLVAGAAGGVGTFVVQLAKARGARVVATASPANHDFLRDLGADEVVDYHGDWVAEVGEVDAAYDCVGGPTWAGCVAAVRDGGRAVSIAAFGSDVTRPGVTLGIFASSFTTPRLAEAAGLIDAGKVKVVVSERLALADAARAHELIETAHVRGKIVLVP